MSVKEIIGSWEILNEPPIRKNGNTFYKCRCLNCNKIHEIPLDNIISGRSTQCFECSKKENRARAQNRAKSYEKIYPQVIKVLARKNQYTSKYRVRLKCPQCKNIREVSYRSFTIYIQKIKKGEYGVKKENYFLCKKCASKNAEKRYYKKYPFSVSKMALKRGVTRQFLYQKLNKGWIPDEKDKIYN